MALSVDPKGASLPMPSEELFRKMAKAGQGAAADYIEDRSGDPQGSIPPGEESEAMWLQSARAMYAVVAHQGGGRIRVLKGGVDK